MPKSRIRKKKKDNRPQPVVVSENPLEMESPRWLPIAMTTSFLLGLIWIVIFYIADNHDLPVPGIGAWNIVIGFSFVGVGFALASRWR